MTEIVEKGWNFVLNQVVEMRDENTRPTFQQQSTRLRAFGKRRQCIVADDKRERFQNSDE